MTIPGISTSVRFFIELVVTLKYSVLFYFLCDCGWILTQFNTYCPERYGSIQSLLDNNPVILIHMFLVCFYFLRHGFLFLLRIRDLYKNTCIGIRV